MMLDFMSDKVVKVTVIESVWDIIATWIEVCMEFDDGFELVKKRQRIVAAAPDDLFKVNEDAVNLKQAMDKSLHSIVAMMLYMTKQARPNTAIAIAYLTTRVREPDKDDWWLKLGHLMQYLVSTSYHLDLAL